MGRISSAAPESSVTTMRETPEFTVAPDLVEILRCAEGGDRHGRQVAPGIGRHCPEGRQCLLQRRATGDRDPAIAVAQRASCALREGAADQDRRMRLLHRLRPGHDRVEIHELAVVLGLGFGPDRLHRLDPFAHQLARGCRRRCRGSPSPRGSSRQPMPNRKRPPETWSSEATSLAVWIGSRWFHQAVAGAKLERGGGRRRHGQADEGSITS